MTETWDVQEILPHRYLLLVDRILELVPGQKAKA